MAHARRKTVLVALTAVTALVGVSSPAPAAEPWEPVGALLDDAVVDCAVACGMELRVSAGDTLLYEHTSGEWTTGQETFLASATKWFTGVTVMAAVDHDTIDLDDRVEDWFPATAGTAPGGITLTQLLSMTSGLSEDAPCVDDRSTTLEACAAEVLALPLAYEPGTAFAYGGAGAMQVAGRMVELATGQTWQQVFDQWVGGPLGMDTFRWSVVPSENPRLSGGAVSNLEDVDRLLAMIEGGGTIRGVTVLSPAAFAELERNRTEGLPVRFTPFPAAVGYALGNWVEAVDATGRTTRASSPGLFGTYPWVDFDQQYRAVLMTQGSYLRSAGLVSDLQPAIVAALAELRAPAVPPTTTAPAAVAAVAAPAFTG